MITESNWAAEPRAEERVVKKRRKALVKVFLTLATLLWFVWRLQARQIADSLAHLNLLWFSLAIAVFVAGQSLCAWKWSVLSRPLGFRMPLRFYWTQYLGAMYPSLFLPTSVGGDVFRMVALARSDPRHDRGGALVSVLADRGTGVLAMACVASLAAAAGGTAGLPPAMSRTIYTLFGGLCLLFVFPFALRKLPFRKIFTEEALSALPAPKLRAAIGRVLVCWEHPPALLAAVAISLLFQAMMGVIYLLLGRAIGLSAPPQFYFIAAPIASLAALSPVTINGLGERLAALVVLFAAVGMARDQAVVFGLEWTALAMLAALFGGAVLLASERSGADAVPASCPGTAST